MIVDFDQAAPPLDGVFDVCIAGAGVAGVAIALKLADAGRRVAVIEAGGLTPSDEGRAFYRGENIGTPNLPLDATRVSALGGSSNHWGGWCRAFDPIDFERSDYAPDGSWPIGASDLAPYLEEARAYLGVNQGSGADAALSGAAGNLGTIRMTFSVPPENVGIRFRDRLAALPNLVLVVNAAAGEAEVDAHGSITAVAVRSAKTGATTRCSARLLVLAMGTVDNCRRMLMWNAAHGDRLGNATGMVGRYYLQHLHQRAGEFVLFGDAPSAAGGAAQYPETFVAGSAPFLTQLGIGNFRLYSTAIDCRPLAGSLKATGASAACAAIVSGGQLLMTCEQIPNADSRLLLASGTDVFGDPQARLDWRISAADARTLREACLEFGRYLIRAGLGRLKVNAAILDGSDPLAGWLSLPSALGAAGHQMGGLRMGDSAATGVVDADCRVWGTENLYVAGSAVFRTCGHANPTLTVTQLALRLAKRLDAVLA